MAQYDLVGGPWDGEQVTIDGDIAIGFVFQNPDKSEKNIIHTYEYRKDGRFHSVGYEARRLEEPQDSHEATKQQLAMGDVLLPVFSAIEDLNRFCLKHGFPPEIQIGERWTLVNKRVPPKTPPEQP